MGENPPKIEQGIQHVSKDSSKNQLVIAFLVCDEPAEPTLKSHGGFDDILHNLMEPILRKADPDLELVVEGFDVVDKREYPSYEYLSEVDCVMISGSFVEDAGVNTAWISRLVGYVDVWPQIRILGICFGHQIIARAFGSTVSPMEHNNWEIGATELSLTDLGRKLIGTPGEHEENLTIQQIHADEVKTVPDGFELLASSKKCKVQMLVKEYEGEPPNFKHRTCSPGIYKNMHIYTTQGHPEWSKEVIIPLVDDFEKDGKFSKEIADEGRRLAEQSDDAEILGNSILRFLGVAKERTHRIMADVK